MTIPASAVVNVTPSVLAAGGSALDLNGLLLTLNTRVPIGTVQSFASADDVQDFFGGGTDEASAAAVYFEGFDNSTLKPGALLMAQYPQDAVAAYLRGGDISALVLADLQGIAGTLTVIMDGFTFTAGSLNLSSATSFSSAATLIQSALNGGAPSGASFTGAITGDTLTVSSSTGTVQAGQVLGGGGVTAQTYIVDQISGSPGGNGDYTVSISQTVGSEAMTSAVAALTVTYDSVSGAFKIASGITGPLSTAAFATGSTAASLLLTSATGAVLSQGASEAIPAAFMTALTQVSSNWATFATIFDPDSVDNTVKLAFATWTGQRSNRYGYVCWDTDLGPSTTSTSTGSLGGLIAAAGISGVSLIGRDAADTVDFTHAAFELGIGASIDFTETNGRTTYKFRSQSGLVPTVTNLQAAANLEANGYNYYGAYATANDNFEFFANGVVSGPFDWMDSFVNQIWLNNNFQLTLVVLLQQAKSIPYNAAGYTRIAAALQDPINAGLNFGAFRPGVNLSSSEITSVNAVAGFDIATTLQNLGWYLLIKPAAPAVRQARGSPPMTFFYVDGQSVQKIDLASVEVE